MNAFTSTMRDSVWTEGKPQSPPQHLSSMVAAMFVFCRDQEVGDVKKKKKVYSNSIFLRQTGLMAY